MNNPCCSKCKKINEAGNFVYVNASGTPKHFCSNPNCVCHKGSIVLGMVALNKETGETRIVKPQEIKGSSGSTDPVHLPPTGVNGYGEIIGCHCPKCLPQEPPLPPKVVNDLKDAGWKFEPQQPNDWEKELKKLGFGGLARITLKPFITSLLSTQKEEWISKIEKMKTPLDESDDSAYHRDIGFNDAINDIISLLK